MYCRICHCPLGWFPLSPLLRSLVRHLFPNCLPPQELLISHIYCVSVDVHSGPLKVHKHSNSSDFSHLLWIHLCPLPDNTTPMERACFKTLGFLKTIFLYFLLEFEFFSCSEISPIWNLCSSGRNPSYQLPCPAKSHYPIILYHYYKSKNEQREGPREKKVSQADSTWGLISWPKITNWTKTKSQTLKSAPPRCSTTLFCWNTICTVSRIFLSSEDNWHYT